MSTRLRVLIADDEKTARARLTRLLGSMPHVECVGECSDGAQVLSRVAQGGIDAVFLDIDMPNLNGTEAMALWPKDGPLVVFCTAHENHAAKAFDTGAVDYVLKPVEPERLARAVERLASRLPKDVAVASLSRLPIETRAGVVLLDPSTITHCVLEDELVTVFAGGNKHLTAATLGELEHKLPPGLLERVHRRALLNLNAVLRLEPLETGGYLAHVSGGHTVEVSRQSARELRKRLGLRQATE